MNRAVYLRKGAGSSFNLSLRSSLPGGGGAHRACAAPIRPRPARIHDAGKLLAAEKCVEGSWFRLRPSGI